MRGKNLYMDPINLKILRQNDVKIQNSTRPKFEISIFEKYGFGKNEKWGRQNRNFDF